MAMKLADLERLNLRALPTDAKPIVAEPEPEKPKVINTNFVQLRIKERFKELCEQAAVKAIEGIALNPTTIGSAAAAFKNTLADLEKGRDALLEAAATK